jgi:protocatechuate 3,4-dioxygenase alpha subunit
LSADFCGFGRLPTREDGTCTFETIRPGRVPDHRGGLQASHVNVCVFARGLLRHLYTRIYFDRDAALADDIVLALVPEDRRATLLAHQELDGSGRWTFDIKLQGENETVFFDL